MTETARRFRKAYNSFTSRLKTHYGINLNIYNEMLRNQNYRCAICSKEHKFDKRLHTDHCHKTNKVRGLLCDNCNKGLGHFRDNPEFLIKAIKYLNDT